MKSADRGGNKAPLYRCRGFTLIELMATIVVGAILLALAAPAFTELIARNRMTTAVNTFIANLQVARSEAVKRGIAVSLCPSTDAANCLDSTEWHGGYVVFADLNNNGTKDDGEPALRSVDGTAAAPITIKKPAGNKWISYLQDGTSSAVVTVVFCDGGGVTQGKRVTIEQVGYMHTEGAGAGDCAGP